MVKKFFCGLCKKEKLKMTTRKGLRNHLKQEHMIVNQLANTKEPKGTGQRHTIREKQRQDWWGYELWD